MIQAGTLLGTLLGDTEIEALFSDRADLAAQLRVEATLAEVQAAHDLIAPEAAEVIAATCRTMTLDHAVLARAMAQDGVVVPALVKQIRDVVGQPHAAAVHRGATSQDLIDTSLMLRLGEAVDILDARLAALLDRLSSLAERDGGRALMGHTRMQVALPITAGDKIAAWRAPLDRHRARLTELRPRLLVLQLGGPVGTRAELGPAAEAIAASLADRLGLMPVPPWHSQRDGIAEFGSWLSLVAGSLGKIGQDVALMAQNEVGTVKLTGGGSSSAMAHKQNPVAAEVLVALARFTAGSVGTLHQALVHENERSGAAWTLEWLTLPPMVVAAGASLRIAGGLLDSITFA